MEMGGFEALFARAAVFGEVVDGGWRVGWAVGLGSHAGGWGRAGWRRGNEGGVGEGDGEYDLMRITLQQQSAVDRGASGIDGFVDVGPDC